MDTEKKIGLALGGGGARGLAHIGVAKVLAENKIKLHSISGTSMGALIGACLAVGIDALELEKRVLAMRKRDMVKLLDISHPALSLVSGQKIINFIKEVLNDAEFSDTLLPFAAVATDLASGKEVIIDKGKLVLAVQASIAVPGIFPPVKVGEQYLIDGGLVNPTPVDLCFKQGADAVIGVDLIAKRPRTIEKLNMLNVLMQSYEIIRTQSIKYKSEQNLQKIVIISPDTGGALDSFRFADMQKIIAHGESEAKKMLPEIKKLISEG